MEVTLIHRNCHNTDIMQTIFFRFTILAIFLDIPDYPFRPIHILFWTKVLIMICLYVSVFKLYIGAYLQTSIKYNIPISRNCIIGLRVEICSHYLMCSILQ